MGDITSQKNEFSSWSDLESRGGGEADLASLPAAVRAIVEECRVKSTNPPPPEQQAGEVLPYPCRMYEESIPGEEGMLQLQWMRLDMSNMDSERCWGEASLDGEHDCGPDSGLVLPAVYSMDPAQVLPPTMIGLPPELQRDVQGGNDGFCQWTSEDVPEDHLFKLGEKLTEAFSGEPGGSKRGEGLPSDVVAEVASLSRTDWSVCLERYVDFRRCDPAAIAQVLLAASPPTLDCLLGTVLPGLVTKISSRSAPAKAPTSSETGTKDSSASGRTGGEQAVSSAGHGQRDTAALLAICRLAASVAASVRGGADPVAFRDKVSGSELRKLGTLGKEAEVALAEAFFYGEGAGAAF
ncbi:unnamed protein product [Ectocarpus fasciculatus]